jgi:hypothetical protein
VKTKSIIISKEQDNYAHVPTSAMLKVRHNSKLQKTCTTLTIFKIYLYIIITAGHVMTEVTMEW